MVDQCCVDGCLSYKEDINYYKLPVSRTLRKRWLEAIKSTMKLTDDAVVCSRHFQDEQYMFVRGKRRLKPKVVPCVFEEKEKSETEKDETEAKCETAVDNQNEKNDGEGKESKGEEENVTVPEPCHSSPKEDKNLVPDLEFSPNKDIEDILTNYHIKQIRPLSQITAEREVSVSEKDKPSEGDSNKEIDQGNVENVALDPKYVEISVGEVGQDQPNEDCLMLLENVQVEIDPALFPELEQDQSIEEIDLDQEDNSSDCIDLGEKKDAPISLLSSSDEDDVIIQEPKIDTIDVSDATDEDDVPLLKLAKRHKKTKKRPSEKMTAINKIMLNKFRCEHCTYTAVDAADYKIHANTHTHVLHICDICTYTTSSWALITRHKEKHGNRNSKKMAKKYKCPLCNYSYKHNMSLVYHMSTHGDKSSYGCERCGFFSISQETAAKHREGCTGVKHACKFCSYSTVNRICLKRHMRKQHKDESYDGDYVPPGWV
ncbi:unnamed protein product [Leptosia nina]|uniref:Uncharacterized protein n=1 Tax=Leptosia nina TaxID=320188 RepID=A0AAV1K1E5_9NEOP